MNTSNRREKQDDLKVIEKQKQDNQKLQFIDYYLSVGENMMMKNSKLTQLYLLKSKLLSLNSSVEFPRSVHSLLCPHCYHPLSSNSISSYCIHANHKHSRRKFVNTIKYYCNACKKEVAIPGIAKQNRSSLHKKVLKSKEIKAIKDEKKKKKKDKGNFKRNAQSLFQSSKQNVNTQQKTKVNWEI